MATKKLENVIGLAVPQFNEFGERLAQLNSKLASGLKKFDVIGFVRPILQLDERCFGNPQNKERFWMTFVLHAVLDELKVAEKRFYDELTKTMDKFCDHGMVPVDRLLLSSDHPAVQEMLQDAEAMGKVRQERKEEEEGQAAEGRIAVAEQKFHMWTPRKV